ncbi:M64 family metallopeptidase [Patescibacteria group bacterium]|nr:M64 family metallopeptidase [Patescibacteria group bacterium]MBU1075442.1 M64 family metallopeptidase [Patescibacteria group bacterium]MBU1952011.1 M64 family metallopeptidase [Patescibacteria group bacterium]
MKKIIISLLILIFGGVYVPTAFTYQNSISGNDIVFFDAIDPKTSQPIGGYTTADQFYTDAKSNQAPSDPIEDTPFVIPNNCTRLQHSGDPTNRLDIVFVPVHQYGEVGSDSKFAQDVSIFIQEFKDFPQMSDNMDKMNFYRIDSLNFSDGCMAYQQNPVCDRDMIIDIVSQCPGFNLDNNDQIVILFDQETVPVSYSRAEPDYNMAYLQSSAPYLMMHEFGHSFAGLGDEYNSGYPASVDPWFPNCASETPGFTCDDKWGSQMDSTVGCYEVCGATNWYRPTFSDSVMKNVFLDHFCPISTEVVDRLLSIYRDQKPMPVSIEFSAPNHIIR